MPFTFFHLSSISLGVILFSVFYIPALAISSTIIDLEPLIISLNLVVSSNDPVHVFFSDKDDHGFFHTFLGATVIALAVGISLVKARGFVDAQMGKINLSQPKLSDRSLFFSSLIGAYSHIIMDMPTHKDMDPFWPILHGNPFGNLTDAYVLSFIAGIIIIGTFFVYLKTRLKTIAIK